jgi:hypothetical protein
MNIVVNTLTMSGSLVDVLYNDGESETRVEGYDAVVDARN